MWLSCGCCAWFIVLNIVSVVVVVSVCCFVWLLFNVRLIFVCEESEGKLYDMVSKTNG